MKQYDLDGINFLTIRDKSINCNKEAISNYIKAIKQLVKVMINEGNSKIRIHDPLILRHISLYALCKDFRDIFIDQNRCTAGTSRISILPDGNIAPCNLAPLQLARVY